MPAPEFAVWRQLAYWLRDRRFGGEVRLADGIHCWIAEGGELYMRGWAASLDDGAIDGVTVTLEGNAHHCPTELESDDVRRVLGDERLGFCDWEFRHTLQRRTPPAFVEVSARTAMNERALLYAGRIAPA